VMESILENCPNLTWFRIFTNKVNQGKKSWIVIAC